LHCLIAIFAGNNIQGKATALRKQWATDKERIVNLTQINLDKDVQLLEAKHSIAVMSEKIKSLEAKLEEYEKSKLIDKTL
jgi:hypothetical protein